MDKIAKGLGAERGGKVTAGGGYFGAVQVASEVRARFRVPPRGGRTTDPRWTVRRVIPLTPATLERLAELAVAIRERSEVNLAPMQLAGLLLEQALEGIGEE